MHLYNRPYHRIAILGGHAIKPDRVAAESIIEQAQYEDDDNILWYRAYSPDPVLCLL